MKTVLIDRENAILRAEGVVHAAGRLGVVDPLPVHAEPVLVVAGGQFEVHGPLVGAVTGFITGVTGTFVVPAVPYLVGLGLARDVLVQALGLSFTVSTVALGIGLLWHDALNLQAVSDSSIAVVPAVLGMMVGARLRRHVSPERFRRWFFVGLGLLAANLIYGAL